MSEKMCELILLKLKLLEVLTQHERTLSKELVARLLFH